MSQAEPFSWPATPSPTGCVMSQSNPFSLVAPAQSAFGFDMPMWAPPVAGVQLSSFARPFMPREPMECIMVTHSPQLSQLSLSSQGPPAGSFDPSHAADTSREMEGNHQSQAELACVDLPPRPSFAPASFGVYDERLQDDVFLGKRDLCTEQIVKNTFIHIPVVDSLLEDCESNQRPALHSQQSAPSALIADSWSTKFPAMEAAHIRKECSPCAYFLYKKDGCHQGQNCSFCHLCARGEIKRRKRQKAKALREAGVQKRAEEAACTKQQEIISGK
eukprot:CAMPEP_0197637990 /NCGR_PEP_ID=MMETSP1338-20131121/13040_1 /TAXON_ID=43686 ORGANISM="Pelagodinium beii, Strain RCC1491" /NCGR_SAMPLE_ID=MMETSP1338 /ASSEMBLY_ACC=CAM_ASM_000754 /LENGTH=274 /DNA_ID=CAMNT_0043210491 /DNA_START=286 /DNA_END=1110 /DNA_ORIENTATION=-